MSFLHTLDSLANEIRMWMYANPNKSIENIRPLLQSYIGCDWRQYVAFSDTQYRSTLLPFTKFRDNFDMYLICWKDGQSSKIHNHPQNGCILKVLDGCLKETRYPADLSSTKKIVSYYQPDNISYIDDTIGFHMVGTSKDTISLHIYSPPHFESKILEASY